MQQTTISAPVAILSPVIGKLMAKWIVDAFRLERFSQLADPWNLQDGSSVISGKLTR